MEKLYLCLSNFICSIDYLLCSPFLFPKYYFVLTRNVDLYLTEWNTYVHFSFVQTDLLELFFFLIALSLNWLNNGLMMSAGSSNVTVYLKCDSVVFAYCALSNCTILVYVSAHCAFSSLSCIFCDFSYMVASFFSHTGKTEFHW